VIAALDGLIIVFLYVNVLVPQSEVFGLSISKIVAAACLSVLLACVARDPVRLSSKFRYYLLVSLAIASGLGFVSLLKGNSPSNITQFVFPFLVLPLSIAFVTLFEHRGPDRYLLHLMRAITILAVYVVVIYAIIGPGGLTAAGPLIIQRFPHTSIAGYLTDKGPVRISVPSGGFFAGGMLLALYYTRLLARPWYVLYAAAILFALYLSQTAGLWIGTAVAGTVLVVFATRRPLVAASTFILLCAILAGAAMVVGDRVVSSKIDSASQKVEQSRSALQLLAEKPFLGQGIGYLYHRWSVPSLSGERDVYLESSYAMMLSSSGLLGTIAYGFVYLWSSARFARAPRRTAAMKIVFAGNLSILIAGVGNPFVWSGGLGLFFPILLAAILEQNRALPNVVSDGSAPSPA
jgi:hypothetical protein